MPPPEIMNGELEFKLAQYEGDLDAKTDLKFRVLVAGYNDYTDKGGCVTRRRLLRCNKFDPGKKEFNFRCRFSDSTGQSELMGKNKHMKSEVIYCQIWAVSDLKATNRENLE